MLILRFGDVRLCSVTTDGKTERRGLIYRNKNYLFHQEYEFKSQAVALTEARALLERGVLCLVVREVELISLWVAHPTIQAFVPKTNLVKTYLYRGTRLSAGVL